MPNPPILFQREASAKALVAGLPCVARAVLAVMANGGASNGAPLQLATAQGWTDTRDLRREIVRVCPRARVEFSTFSQLEATEAFDALECIEGDAPAALPFSNAVERTLGRDPKAEQRIRDKVARSVIAGTTKPTDGLVSRHLNRPISQFLSRHALRLRGIRPIHATIAAGLIGIAMALCLFLGGGPGLVAGAILFQLASIVDGVDGEIARATFRTSQRGASLDTATDAATNFAFIAGVSANLLQSGSMGGWAGLLGLAILATGLTIIGTLSLRSGGPLSFDALKHDALVSGSPLMIWLSKVTSRDVYALVLALLIVAGFAAPAMFAFALAIAIWFVVAMAMLWRRADN